MRTRDEKSWMISLVAITVLGLIVLMSHIADWRIDQEDFRICVSKQMHLGAEHTIAEKLCKVIHERD